MITPKEQERLDDAARRFAERHEATATSGMNVDLLTLNRAGAGRVRGLGFPHKAHERFTYIDTNPLVETELSWSPSPLGAVTTVTNGQVIIAGGRFVSRAGSLRTHPGATVRPLGEALREEPKLNALLASRGVQEEDLFASLAEAAALDGAIIDIPAESSGFAPISVDIVGEGDGIAHPRMAVRIGDGAKATVLIRTLGDRAGSYENGLIDLIVGENAMVEMLIVGDDHPEGRRLTRYRGGVGAGSSITITFLTTGASSSRISFDLGLDGPDASATVAHLSTLVGSTQAHVWGRVAHNAPRGKSRMLFKNVVADTARASVDAAVVVAPHGNGAVSRQEVHSLLLDPGARADAKPTLSIANDDVVCSHGATVGQLDEDALLYLRSRGVDETTARSTLIDAFRREVVGMVEHETLRGVAFDALKQRGRS